MFPHIKLAVVYTHFHRHLNVCFPHPRDPFMVLSGGLSYDTVGRRACLTVMHGKSTAVLEMDYPIVDFLTLCETPYPNGKLECCTVDGVGPHWIKCGIS